jgi:hypothetical protein
MKYTEHLLCGLIFAVVVPLEIACAFLAFETLGEITSGLYFVAVGLNLGFLLVAFRSRLAASVAALALGLVIIPYQLWLGYRLVRVQAEATRIVAFAFEQKAKSGSFPSDLSGYAFRDAATAPYFQGYGLSKREDAFTVRYYIGTPSTSHWYSSKTGWGYYPD